MFLVLHGENQAASRSDLESEKIKAKKKETLVLNGKEVDLTTLKQSLEARSLFGQEKLVIIENLLSQKQDKKILKYLKEVQLEVDLILWEKKEIGKTILSLLCPPATPRLFKPSQFLFKFLESVKPGNHKIMLYLLTESLKNEEPELIFYMLVRQFRNLLLIKDLGRKGVSEMADWQKSRLEGQAKNFELSKLISIYKQLLQIDYQQKTGQNVFNLVKTLELFLVNL